MVTSEDVAPAFVALGAGVISDVGAGLNAACRQGIAAAGDGPVAVMLGDVPALTPAELIEALAAAVEIAEQHPLAFVPDADPDPTTQGTTLITAIDPSAHAPAFGANSRVAHLAADYYELSVSPASGLRRDVDTWAQLSAIPRERLGARTRAILDAEPASDQRG